MHFTVTHSANIGKIIQFSFETLSELLSNLSKERKSEREREREREGGKESERMTKRDRYVDELDR